MSGRRISRQTVYSRLAETGLYAQRPGLCVPLTASMMRLNVPDKAILIESSPGEKMYLAFLLPMKKNLKDLVAKKSLCVVGYC
ncbi:hypothetical protein TNCV_1872641 [Trichonephila clavipes]|nr:hypothetical protein TNCV_1872641 [Trichonephila clavipes]